jgi:hypothetical protein
MSDAKIKEITSNNESILQDFIEKNYQAMVKKVSQFIFKS